MKNRFLATLICLFAISTAFAGNEGTQQAAISSNFQIILPESKEVASIYVADMSALILKDAATTAKLFEMMRESIVGYEVNFENKMLTISPIKNEISKDWTVDEWNSYFEKRAVKFVAVNTVISK